MTHHVLKTHPAMFRAVRDGTKNFDVRKDDRAFQKGDTVELVYHNPETETAWGLPPAALRSDDPRDALKRHITFVMRGGQYGVEDGFVVLALDKAPSIPTAQ